MNVPLERIAQIERAAAEALPCGVRVDDDGWRLRFNDGVTRRCNSVFAERAGGDPLPRKIARAEGFYRQRGAVPRFQLTRASRPQELAEALARRGYRELPGAWVQTATLPALAAQARPEAPFAVRRWGEVRPSWLAALASGSGEAQAAVRQRARNLAELTTPVAFVEIVHGDEVAAVGLAVASGRWMGIFNMATVPVWRRHGAARRALLELASWGLGVGAREAYLQVHPANARAQALYASLGFVTDHAYAYWEAPAGGADQ